ncbi:MAG: hypothetical protein WC343_14900 [Bacilli bacterium]|jgi:hypothetical protein
METELRQIVISKWIEAMNTGSDELCILMLFAPDACPEIITAWGQEQNGAI